MGLVEQIWKWLGTFLAVYLVAVILNAMFHVFPDAANFVQVSVIESALYILVPSGILVLLYILYDGF